MLASAALTTIVVFHVRFSFGVMLFPSGKTTMPSINLGLMAEWRLYKIAQQARLRSQAHANVPL